MTGQNKGLWRTIVTLSMGILVGVGAALWMTPRAPLPETHVNADSQHDQRLGQLEHAVTALTQALQVHQTTITNLEPTCVTAPANHDGSQQSLAQLIREELRGSRQSLAQLIREELRQVLLNETPEAQRARAEELANAEVLKSPENRAAYQSAWDVVSGALAAGRWTEEDKETFRDAFGLLTNDQRTELLNTLAPAINRGEITVEVVGPLF